MLGWSSVVHRNSCPQASWNSPCPAVIWNWRWIFLPGGSSFCALETPLSTNTNVCMCAHTMWNIHSKFLVIEYPQQSLNSWPFGSIETQIGWKLAQFSVQFDSVLMSCRCWVQTKFHICAHYTMFFCKGLNIPWLLILGSSLLRDPCPLACKQTCIHIQVGNLCVIIDTLHV